MRTFLFYLRLITSDFASGRFDVEDVVDCLRVWNADSTSKLYGGDRDVLYVIMVLKTLYLRK